MKNRILLIVTNPLTLSLIFTIVLIYFLPDLFPKYKADLIKKEKVSPKVFYYYCDLDSDGYSEEISLDTALENRIIIIVKTKGTIVDQWAFKGQLNMTEPFFGDFNNDRLKEIFLFSIDKNDILLNCINPFEKKSYLIDRFIDKFYRKNNERNSGLTYCELNDLNKDQTKEFIFAFTAGYSVSPRKLYSYNFASDSLSKSSNGCMSMLEIHSLFNHSTLFIPATHAVGNCDSSSIYSDYFTWLTVFDKDLNFKFEPIKIGNYPSDLGVKPIKIGNHNLLAALNLHSGNNNHKSSIALYDFSGIKIKEREITYSKDWEWAKLLSNNDAEKIYLLRKNGNIEQLNDNLNFEVKYRILPFVQPHFKKIDCDLDNSDEFIFHHQALEKVTILQNDLEDPVVFDITGNTEHYYTGILLAGLEKPKLNLRFENYSYFFEYYKNQYYNFKFLFYSLIYLGIFGFLFALQKAQKYRAEQKFIAEKKIAELQMKSIKNQMDPHFTLNIINSIGSLFSKQETEKANYIFGKYSKLLRNTILNSDQIITTLNDELDYVENYLSLEKFRLKNELVFEIKLDDDINGEVKIPKMLIHTFVENSIKHGIKHLEGNGNILISVSNGLDLYTIKITDNGIGRNKSKEFSTFSTGKGLEILNQILDLYYNLEKVKIIYKIKDLESEDTKSSGTEVLINIPILNS